MVLEISMTGVGGNTTKRRLKAKGMVEGSIEVPSLKKCVKCGVKTIYGLQYTQGWVCISCDKENMERWE